MSDDDDDDNPDEGQTRTQAASIPGRVSDSPVETKTSERPDFGALPISIRERITLRDLHSSGGIGEVWRAYDEVLDREIALKRLQPSQRGDTHRARFEREAKLTGQLEHPGIVPVYDFSPGEDGTHCFYTMRFVQGRTLREVTRDFHASRRAESRPLLGGAFMQLLSYFTSVCNTIAFAHSRSIIHRDLKGDNVIVGNFGEVLVLDWGLAKRIGDAEVARAGTEITRDSVLETRQGEQLGTPAYMAPEQAHGHVDRIDHRTDVYGLAAILYEILTGRPPFVGKLAQVICAVIEQPPQPPHELVVDVPPELEQICLRGLAKDMDARQQSVAELGGAVEAWQSALAERKRIEQEREHFFDLSLDLLTIVDRDGNVRQRNAAWSRVLGREPELGASLFGEVLDDDRARAHAQLDELWAGTESVCFELRMRSADGGYRWIDWSARSLPDDVGAYMVGRDITERKHAAQEVEGLIESAPDAMCVIDEQGTIVRINAQLERMFGLARAQLLGAPVEVLIPEALRERHVHHVRRYIETPSSRPMGSGLRLLGQRADGTSFPVEVSLSPVQTERKLLVACTLRDIGERRRHERTMMAILEAAPDAMLAVDARHIIRLLNRQAEALFGYSRDELLGQPITLLIPERHHAAHQTHVDRFMLEPAPRTMGAGRVLHARRRDGTELAVEISLSPVETDDGVLIASAIRPAKPGS